MSIKSLNFFTVMFVLLVVAMSILSYSFYHLKSTRPRVAFVRSLDLVNGYNGMKEAREEFKQHSEVWQANIDTLQKTFSLKLETYNATKDNVGAPQRKEMEAELDMLKSNLDKYTKVINDQASEKEKELTQSILNQINSFIQDYAKKQSYDMVFGAEGSGVILYGAEAYDVTNEVLLLLNRDYKMIPAANSVKATDSVEKSGN